MYSWFAIDKDASADYRKLSYETYVRTFGPGGIFDQDDMENWEECTAAARGPAAKRYTLHHKMGLYRETATELARPRHVLSRQLRRDDAARVVRGMAAPDDAPARWR